MHLDGDPRRTTEEVRLRHFHASSHHCCSSHLTAARWSRPETETHCSHPHHLEHFASTDVVDSSYPATGTEHLVIHFATKVKGHCTHNSLPEPQAPMYQCDQNTMPTMRTRHTLFPRNLPLDCSTPSDLTHARNDKQLKSSPV